jgi:hypothetical protein
MSRLYAIICRNPAFEFLMDVSVKVNILRDLRPCGLLGIYRRFGVTYCLYLQGGRIP